MAPCLAWYYSLSGWLDKSRLFDADSKPFFLIANEHRFLHQDKRPGSHVYYLFFSIRIQRFLLLKKFFLGWKSSPIRCWSSSCPFWRVPHVFHKLCCNLNLWGFFGYQYRDTLLSNPVEILSWTCMMVSWC